MTYIDNPRLYSRTGTHTIREADLGVDQAALRQRMLERFQSPTYRPPTLPTVATELLALSRRADVKVEAIVKLLEQDTMLAGRVMKLVRSAFYSGVMPVPSLHAAVVRLGLATTNALVLEASMNLRVFRSKEYAAPLERLRRHSSAVAHATRLVCRQTFLAPDYAFLCGLFHDVGLSGALLVLADPEPGTPLWPYEEAWPAVVSLHEEVAGTILRHWGLPEDVQWIAGKHHDLTDAKKTHPMVAAIRIAEYLAAKHGFGGEHDETSEPALVAAREILRLEDAQVKKLVEETRGLAAVVEG